LGALQGQTLSPGAFRILVVDNSLEPEKSLPFRNSLPSIPNLDYRITERCGIGFARGEALRLCETELLAFTDDDCLPPPDWAERILEAVNRHGEAVAVIGGSVLPDWEAERPAWLDDRFLAPLGLLDWGDQEIFIHHESGRWLLTANAVYRVDVLRKAGGFAERLGRRRNLPLAQEEYAANDALSCLGYDLVYSPHLVVRHFVPAGRARQSNFCRDAFWDGVSQAVWRAESLTSQDVDRLADALLPIQEQMIGKFEDVATSDRLIEATAVFHSEGWRSTAELLHVHASQPPPRRPVMFVVTPSFNAAETIDQTVLSVVSQAGRFALRYHVQDGGSTDGTVEKLARWRARLNARDFPIACDNVVFTYDSRPDRGMYSAIAKGFATMSIPQSAYMTWINADDVIMQNALATIAGAGRDLGDAATWIGQVPSVISNKGEVIGFSPTPYPREIIAAGLCDNESWPYVQQEGTFWRKSLWDRVGGLNTELKRAGDWDLWRRFAQHSDLLQVPWMNGVFRKREGQLSSQDGGVAYRAEVDSVVPPAARRAALKAIASRGVENLVWPVLGVDYVTERYGFMWRPAAEQLPPTARTLFTRPTSSAGNIPRLATVPNTAEPSQRMPALVEARPPSSWHSSGRSLLGSSRFRRLYAASPPLVQKGFRIVKRRGILPLLNATRPWRAKRAIRRSGLFFPTYYCRKHPEVAVAGVDPLDHFMAHALVAGHDPNPLFDCSWYLHQNPGLLALGINPLYHYIKAGAKAGRDPGPHFSVSDYRARYPELDIGRHNPLVHYFCVGILDVEARVSGR